MLVFTSTIIANFERKAKALPTSQTQTSQAQNIMANDTSKNGLGSVFVVGVWAAFVSVSWWLKGWRTHGWQERDEPKPSTGCKDYVLIEETHAGPTDTFMFRIKFEGDKAELKLLWLQTWSGGICSPDDTDIAAAKIIVAKLKQVAKENNVKTIRAGIFLGQESMYEACGFKRDAGHLRFVLHV